MPKNLEQIAKFEAKEVVEGLAEEGYSRGEIMDICRSNVETLSLNLDYVSDAISSWYENKKKNLIKKSKFFLKMAYLSSFTYVAFGFLASHSIEHLRRTPYRELINEHTEEILEYENLRETLSGQKSWFQEYRVSLNEFPSSEIIPYHPQKELQNMRDGLRENAAVLQSKTKEIEESPIIEEYNHYKEKYKERSLWGFFLLPLSWVAGVFFGFVPFLFNSKKYEHEAEKLEKMFAESTD